MKTNAFLSLCILSFMLISCEQEEGEGGLNTIEGHVYIQDLDPNLQKIGSPYPAVDEDVYIKYGNSQSIDDDEPTSDSGYFAFKYLMPGDYTLFVESDDTVLFKNEKDIIISRDVNFPKKEQTASLDTITIYNHLDYDDGTAVITGSVTEIIYFDDIFVAKDTFPAKDKQVFLQSNNQPGIIERIRTAHDGTYIFPNIIPGEYYVYTLTEKEPAGDYTALEDSAVGIQINITDENERIEIPNFETSSF
ncbi:MAG: hypothetical protein R6U95_08930 [Bacteroidales bacterium]